MTESIPPEWADYEAAHSAFWARIRNGESVAWDECPQPPPDYLPPAKRDAARPAAARPAPMQRQLPLVAPADQVVNFLLRAPLPAERVAQALRALADSLELLMREKGGADLMDAALNAAAPLLRKEQAQAQREEACMQISRIIKFVAAEYHFTIAQLLAERRDQRVATARQVAMYLCRRLTRASFPEIGKRLHRDHSTVIHACEAISRRIAQSTFFRDSMLAMEKRLAALLTAAKITEQAA